LNAEDAVSLLAVFNSLNHQPAGPPVPKSPAIAISETAKAQALAHYDRFCRTVAFDSSDPTIQASAATELKAAIKTCGLGVLAELNGSARAASIDEAFLTSLGAKVRVVNGTPGKIVHRIVPEGRSLDQCRQELAKAHATDPGFVVGYVPDCDGDRGNLVYIDPTTKQAQALEAQTVFALVVLSELSWLVRAGHLSYSAGGRANQKVAVVVNDPTSMRIDDIAQTFDAKVYRAEVGEANVVNLAAVLRKKGYIVRILGEGSNGGNITHPSAVRDPLHTVVALLRLLAIRDTAEQPSPFGIWCRRRQIPLSKNFSLGNILASLPIWTTTSAYEDRAILTIATTDHGLLKARYETIYKQQWETKKADLAKRLGIVVAEEINYEGIVEHHGIGPQFRSGNQRGGLKILFKDATGHAKASLWMRGSGTEPVFRVAVDVAGHRPELEAELLAWHCAMIRAADAAD
jgi:phosphoglucomutase